MVEEEIALTKDVFKPLPKEFLKTWSEWAADSAGVEQFIRIAQVDNGNITFYTVPKGLTLYLTTAYIDITCLGAGAPVRRGGGLNIQNVRTLIEATITGVGTSKSTSLSFPMPIKLNEGQSLQLGTGDASTALRCGVTGFLIPKLISKPA